MLSLTDVYGAITFYRRHRNQAKLCEALRDESNSKSVAPIQRLREERAGLTVEFK